MAQQNLLKFTTSGSVDDGKSTLIGRLLFESKSIYEDQYQALSKRAEKLGQEIDLAHLLDGLAAEREQGITIDVAYRYFSTTKRHFMLADCPGHEQYTRNMISGASQADLAIILIDAQKGILPQSRRHGFLLSLLQVQHLIVAVNKMDLVDYSQNVFENLVEEYKSFSKKLEIHDILYIPVSALKGDNIVQRSPEMPWYQGTTLLHHLENVEVTADQNLIDFRFPVQYVLRPNANFRGYAGRLASGEIRKNESIVVFPSQQKAKIESIFSGAQEIKQAKSGDSVVLTLDRELDISRGDLICRTQNTPFLSQSFDAMLCWMDEISLKPQKRYLLKHTTRQTPAWVDTINYAIDVNTLHRQEVQELKINEIGRVQIQSTQPLFVDLYRLNRKTGAFILIDPESGNTVAAGMIRKPKAQSYNPEARHISPSQIIIPRERWEQRNGHKAAVLWLTGLSGSGKSSIAHQLIQQLFEENCQVQQLDGDNVRHGLCSDLGFNAEARRENIRRVGECARLFFEQGNLVVCSFISPYQADRDKVRSLFPKDRFLEIFIHCPLEVCQQRDPKGLYAKATRGEIQNFTGIDAPYQIPEFPDLTVQSDSETIDQACNRIMFYLKAQNILSSAP